MKAATMVQEYWVPTFNKEPGSKGLQNYIILGHLKKKAGIPVLRVQTVQKSTKYQIPTGMNGIKYVYTNVGDPSSGEHFTLIILITIIVNLKFNLEIC